MTDTAPIRAYLATARAQAEADLATSNASVALYEQALNAQQAAYNRINAIDYTLQQLDLYDAAQAPVPEEELTEHLAEYGEAGSEPGFALGDS